MITSTKNSGDILINIDPRPLNKTLNRELYQLLTIYEVPPRLMNANYFTKLDMASVYWHAILDNESS